MDACTFPDPVPQDLDCKSCVYFFPRHTELSHMGSKDPFLEDVCFPQPITDICGQPDDTSSISNLVNLFESSLKVHHVNSTAVGELKNQHINFDHGDTRLKRGHVEYTDEEICQLDTCCISSQESLERSEAFPWTHEVTLSSQFVDLEDALCMELESEGCSKQGHTSYAPSSMPPLPLNSSPKPVSAMKGTREKQGLAPKVKMSVKWAPDVYDPPVTLVSHTVKSPLKRPKAKKDKHKHKHKGGKVGRGSYTGRKQSNRNIAIDNDLQLRLRGPAERLLLSTSSSSATKLVEFALNSNESKCGSSFLVNPFAEIHIPVGQAI